MFCFLFKYTAIEDIDNDWLEYCKVRIIENPKRAFMYKEFLPQKRNLQTLDAENEWISLLNDANEKYLF